MNYQEMVDYIESIPKFTSKTSLAHTQRFLSALGNPERELRVIHVAGTNGKGSVCAYLDAALRACNKRVGRFTSPHLVRINERIAIDGAEISDEAFLAASMRVMEVTRQLESEGEAHPTYFEWLFLMAILCFAEQKLDLCILETGLGGRLDATNVIRKPQLCVITSIGIDHTAYLGDTIPEIAGEKAGIIKPGVPLVYDGTDKEAAAVIRARAKAQKSPAYEVTEEMIHLTERTKRGLSFTFRDAKGGEIPVQIASVADYQMQNASLAMQALMLLSEVDLTSALRGIREGVWPCRMEVVREGVVIDGAHNEDGIRAFLQTLKHFQEMGPVTILFSAVSDKDYASMIRLIAKEARPAHVVTTSVRDARRVSAEVLADCFRQCGIRDVTAEESIEKAAHFAYSMKGEGMLFCVGSLYSAGAVKDALLQIER